VIDDDCGSGRFCNAGTCFNKLPLGGDCVTGIADHHPNWCMSGNCCFIGGCAVACFDGCVCE
jgi:hypothetical protein